MLEIFGCVAWEPRSFSVFVRYTLHVTQLWASGAMNFSTASQNISPPIWKRKWFMWQSIRVLGKAMIAEQGSECLDRVWKICQKLRQKIFEDHLRPPPANCFDKQANPTDHKTILRSHLISKYWNMNPLSCMRGKWSNFFGRKQLPGYSCQVSPLYRPIFWRCEVQSIWLPFVKMSPKLCSPGSRCFHQQLCINWKPCGLWNDKIYTNQNSYCTSYRISGNNVNWEASGIWHFVNTEWKFL